MRPKGKLFALVAVFAAIGVVVATGAFTTVSADRTAEVDVTGDSAALLGLEPADSDNGDSYASNTSSGELELVNLGDINPDAITEIDDVFTITNNGNQEITLTIQKTGDNSGAVTFYEGAASDGTSFSSNTIDLTVGESIDVSMLIDTDDNDLSEGDELLQSITINANATAA